MATPERISADSSSSTTGAEPAVPSGLQNEQWSFITDFMEMTDNRSCHFAEGVGDSQQIHFNDDLARSLGRDLKGRIMHGKLLLAAATNALILEAEDKKFGVSATHVAMDMGGSYGPPRPVYPGEYIFVRYNRSAQHRPRGSYPLEITFAVYVIRDGEEIKVLEGTQKAFVAYRRPLKEAEKS